MAGQGVRIYLGYPAGCEASDADSRKAFGDGYQAAVGAHRGILQRLYDKVKNTKGVLPNCGRTPLFSNINCTIFTRFLTLPRLSDNINP